MKKGQVNMMVVIMLTVVLAMVAISVVWGLVRSQQDTTAVVDDQFTGINGTCVRVTGNCILPASTTSIINAISTDENETSGNFTECGTGGLTYGYNTNEGTWKNMTGVLMNASYTEQACGRITGLTGQVIDYIPLLMAVVILVFVSMFAIK